MESTPKSLRALLADEFALLHMACPDDPREAVKAMIAAHVAIALDPSVSERAAALVQQGRSEATQQSEPFGYFRALPMGWEQCSEHDEGAVALYTSQQTARQPMNEDLRITQIREAINGYYLALDQRKHGGVAESLAFNSIERVMGMHWVQGAALAAAQAKEGGAE